MSTARSQEDKEDDRQGWMAGMLAGKGSSAAVAFLCTKALTPIRAGITLTATPLLHRYAVVLSKHCVLCRSGDRWLTGRAAHAIRDASKKSQQ